MKTTKFIWLPLFVGLAALSLTATPGHAAKKTAWHTGTPKALRGTWYHNGTADNKAYITYTAHKSVGNLFQESDTATAFYKLPGYGLKKLTYRKLSKHVYQLSGIQYSPKGAKVQFDGQRMTYKVKVLSKHRLHFYKGYASYVKQPTFTIVAHH